MLRPQRLIHIGLDEEMRRVHESWWYSDWVMLLACFAPIEELGNHVENPETFRDNVKKTVICHSDQMPFWIKLQPGKQLYAPEELPKTTKKPLTKAEGESTQKNFHGSQKKETRVDADGMTQLRGECHGNQDKFRITMDLEQVVYGFFDGADVTPQADFGLTSVIFSGQHFRESNVDENRCYIEDEKFERDGIEICHLAGTRVQAGLGSQTLKVREDHLDMFAEMKASGFRFYQQPAGFEDALLTCWKVQEQQKEYGQNLATRDLFTGALSKEARDLSFLCQQLSTWIRGKVTAVIQTADCIVIKLVKVKTAQKHQELRRELIALAEHEDTGASLSFLLFEFNQISRIRFQKVSTGTHKVSKGIQKVSTGIQEASTCIQEVSTGLTCKAACQQPIEMRCHLRLPSGQCSSAACMR